jgi:hypothetical protein
MGALPPPSRTPAWRWAALLGFAMLAPAALPAGGGERRMPEVRRRESRREPLVTSTSLSLRCAPHCEAPTLARLEPGVPLRVLRQWLGPNGNRWLQVETPTPAGLNRRGWLAG